MKRTLVFALAWLPVGCGGGAAERPTLFAAASLREAVEEVCELYASEGNPRPRVNIAASNLLARQILAGGRADLFFSADELQVDQVDAAGLVAERRSLLSNRLAVIYPEGIEYPTMLVNTYMHTFGTMPFFMTRTYRIKNGHARCACSQLQQHAAKTTRQHACTLRDAAITSGTT